MDEKDTDAVLDLYCNADDITGQDSKKILNEQGK